MAKPKSTIAARRTTGTRSSSGGKRKGAQQTTAWKRDQGDKREEDSDAVEIDDQDIVESTNESDGSDYQEEDAEDSGGSSEEDSDEELDESDSDFEVPSKRKGKRPKTKTSRQRQGRPLPAAKAPVKDKRDGEQRGGGIIENKQEPASADRSSTAAANEAASHATAREEPERLNSSTPVKEAVTPATVNTAAGGKEAMTYVWEIAKTSRAMCRRCDDKISKGALKIGVVTEGSWGPSTQWHHLQCTVFRIKKAEEIEGFNDLDDALLPILEKQVKKSQGEVDDMYEPITPDDLVRKEWSEKAQCPRDVMATLLPYQQEGLAWMLNQEKLDYKGGILADEMGMGKTLQAICTIVANRPNALDETMQQRWAKSEADMCGEGASATKRGGTLVVCPTIALKQWQSELARFVKPGTLKVVIHHGANRATRAEDLIKADVVLTTYAIVENEHRKAFASAKVSCPDCGRSLYPDKMFVHRKYFCGESAQMTEAQAKTQRKGKMAPWRRKDANEKLKKKGVKGNKMKGDVADSDSDNGGTTDIKVKVRGKTRGSKTRGSNRGGRSDGSDGSENGDGGMTKLNVRVRVSAKAKRSTKATGRGNGNGKAGNRSSGEKDSAQGSQTDVTRPARKRRKSTGGVVEERTTDISGRRGKKENKAAMGKGVKVLQENGAIRVINIRTK